MQVLKQWRLVSVLPLTSLSFGQQANKARTNDDVVSTVKSSLPEDVILNAIQANESNFDTSANALIAPQKAGIDYKVMNAMLAGAAGLASGTGILRYSGAQPSSASPPPCSTI